MSGASFSVSLCIYLVYLLFCVPVHFYLPLCITRLCASTLPRAITFTLCVGMLGSLPLVPTGIPPCARRFVHPNCILCTCILLEPCACRLLCTYYYFIVPINPAFHCYNTPVLLSPCEPSTPMLLVSFTSTLACRGASIPVSGGWWVFFRGGGWRWQTTPPPRCVPVGLGSRYKRAVCVPIPSYLHTRIDSQTPGTTSGGMRETSPADL